VKLYQDKKIYILALSIALPLLIVSCRTSFTPNISKIKGDHAQILVLKYLMQPMASGPCLASLVGPPSAKFHCMQWVANIDAAPTYERARNFIFTGSGDNFLHVIDANSGAIFSRIPTTGRVVTKVVFNPDGSHIYFGTDQGVVCGFDAFKFTKLFSFQADSRINNDIMLVSDSLLFSSGLATVYKISLDGQESWRAVRPIGASRLRLASNSNLFFLKSDPHGLASGDLVAAPHPDGYISVFDFMTSHVLHNIELTQGGIRRAFPDIVAPMLYVGQALWVASYDLGIARIDPRSGQIISHVLDQKGQSIQHIQEMATDQERIYAASNNNLMAFSLGGEIVWQKNIEEFKTKNARYGFPFERFETSPKRLFNGLPSRLLLSDDRLIMATSLGAMGMFDIRNGELRQVVGNSLGFGPKIDFLGNQGVIAMTPRGSLALFLLEKLRKGGNQL